MSRTSPKNSAPSPSFTADDLLGSLAALMAERPQAEGMTTDEIGAARGWSKNKVKDALKLAAKAGKLTPARAYRLAIDGTMRPVPVYRLGA